MYDVSFKWDGFPAWLHINLLAFLVGFLGQENLAEYINEDNSNGISIVVNKIPVIL